MEDEVIGSTTQLPDDPKEKPKPSKSGKLSLVESAKLAKKWSVEINAAKKWMEKFHRDGVRCEKAYFGRGDEMINQQVTGYEGRVNLFWSNVQVILSAIYGRLPKASVERRFKDYTDDESRVAAIMMQRILNGDMERDWDDTNAAMRDAVLDRFVPGMGQVWCRYDVDIVSEPQPVIDPLTQQPMMDAAGEPVMQEVERIENEEAEVDYVHWQDFLYSPCRRWRECRWVARRVPMDKDSLKARFKLSDAQVAMVPMRGRATHADDALGREDDVMKATPFQQALVWEIWEKKGNYVCWYVEGCTFVLDQQPDPLELDEFWPCPQPVVATTLTKAFLPRADYVMAQDLYKELDQINNRIAMLTRAVKAAGVYDKSAAPVKQLLTTAVENALVPVDNWTSFLQDRGGLKGVTDWLPIEQFVNAIIQLNQRKAQLQQDLYEVLGISDILRGTSVASETATAQELKVQYGGARLANLQNDVARFVSEVMRIRANIIANVWQPETIIERSQIMSTPDAPFAQAAVQKLKDFGTALYSIKVTADSLSAPDWAAEKEARTEFLGAASNFIMSAAPLVQQAPAVGSFLVQLLQWCAAGFKGADTIEGVLDQAAKQLEQEAQSPPSPPEPTAEDKRNEAQAAKYAAEAKKTEKEANLIPPMQLGAPNGSMPPGGPAGPGLPPDGGAPPGADPAAGLPPGGGADGAGLPAAPGTVAPLDPSTPLPPAPMQ